MNATCDLELMEALAFDELPLEQARRAREHAGACGPCGVELSALREDRARFHARAAAQPALPRMELYAQVERVAQLRLRRQRVRREVMAFALCAASLLCVLGLSARSTGGAVQLSAAGVSRECVRSSSLPPGFSPSEDCGLASVDEIGQLEDDLGACLVATPADCR